MTIYFSLEGVLVDQKIEWLQGSKEVFEGVSDFARSIGWNVKILAKYNKKKPESKSEIYDWCIKNLGLSKSKIKPVPNIEDKLKYANPETFLIDPKIEIVNGFMYSGGTAILFDGLATGVKKIKFYNLFRESCVSRHHDTPTTASGSHGSDMKSFFPFFADPLKWK